MFNSLLKSQLYTDMINKTDYWSLFEPVNTIWLYLYAAAHLIIVLIAIIANLMVIVYLFKWVLHFLLSDLGLKLTLIMLLK